MLKKDRMKTVLQGVLGVWVFVGIVAVVVTPIFLLSYAHCFVSASVYAITVCGVMVGWAESDHG